MRIFVELKRRLSGGAGRLMPPAAAFVVGASVMAVEITASRLLAPYFGATIFVWTSLILMVLLALSFGYWLGGKIAEREVGPDILAWMMMGAALLQSLGARVSGAVASNMSSLLLDWQAASLAMLLGSFASAAITLAIPMVVLGSMSPLIIKSWAARSDVAKASSGYLLSSTLGGAVGTLAPTLLFIPTIGTQRTVGLFSLALFLCGFALLARGRRRRVWPAIFLVAAMAGLGDKDHRADVIADRETPYQLIRVVEDGGQRYMVFNEGLGVQSVSLKPGERSNLYYDYFGLVPLLRPQAPPDHKVAMLGVAGATSARTYPALVPGISPDITGVEIDPAAVDLARRYFDLDLLPMRTVVDDGRSFLRRTGDRYQTIIVDAYSVQIYIPYHMVSREFFSLVSSRLEPGGIMAFNLNATSPDTPLFRTLTNTAASVFPHVVAIPQSGSWNWLILASDENMDLAAAADRLPSGYEDMRHDVLDARGISFDYSGPVFTDDWSPVEFMTETMMLKGAWDTRAHNL